MLRHPLVQAITEATGSVPCNAASIWLEDGDYTDLAHAWSECPRADWLLWFAEESAGGALGSDARKQVVLAACDCADLGLRLVPDEDSRPRQAVEAARAWCRGDADLAAVLEASTAADVAAYHASRSCTQPNVWQRAYRDSALAAFRASKVIITPGWANFAAQAVADAIAWAACGSGWSSATWYAARDVTLHRCANIVRRHYPVPPAPDRG